MTDPYLHVDYKCSSILINKEILCISSWKLLSQSWVLQNTDITQVLTTLLLFGCLVTQPLNLHISFLRTWVL